jgi:hypothetical protein
MANDGDSILENIEQVMFPLFAVTSDAKWHPVGTAFVVATFEDGYALLFTAAHNLKYVMHLDKPYSSEHPTTPIEFLKKKANSNRVLEKTNLYALVKYDEEPFLAALYQAQTLGGSDLGAFMLRLDPRKKKAFKLRFAINSAPVELGKRLTAFGYKKMQFRWVEEPNYDENRFDIEIGYGGPGSKDGRVTQLCPKGIGINKWPGYLTNIPIDSGMSGGPLIDFDGEIPTVRGIIGADISLESNEQSVGSGIQAFASALHPILAMEFPIQVRKDGKIVPTNSILDMAANGIIQDVGEPKKHFKKFKVGENDVVGWI